MERLFQLWQDLSEDEKRPDYIDRVKAFVEDAPGFKGKREHRSLRKVKSHNDLKHFEQWEVQGTSYGERPLYWLAICCAGYSTMCSLVPPSTSSQNLYHGGKYGEELAI